MLDCLLRLLVFFLIAQFVSSRGFKRGGPLDVSGAVAVWAIVEQFGVWPYEEPMPQNVGSRAVQAAVLPRALLTLIPKVWLVVSLKVFPGSSPLNPGMHGP